jgi:hypothetical protein
MRIEVDPNSGWGSLSFSPQCSLPVPFQGTRGVGVGMEVEAMASTAGIASVVDMAFMAGMAGEV